MDVEVQNVQKLMITVSEIEKGAELKKKRPGALKENERSLTEARVQKSVDVLGCLYQNSKQVEFLE